MGAYGILSRPKPAERLKTQAALNTRAACERQRHLPIGIVASFQGFARLDAPANEG